VPAKQNIVSWPSRRGVLVRLRLVSFPVVFRLPLTFRAGTLEAWVRGVLLHKQGEGVAALLPRWRSGYAFLAIMNTHSPRAEEIRSTIAAGITRCAAALRLCTEGLALAMTPPIAASGALR
jgi:hypothetical protein